MTDYKDLLELLRMGAKWAPIFGKPELATLFTNTADAIESLCAKLDEIEHQKPVAWYIDDDEGREYNGTPEMSNGRTGIPLYTKALHGKPLVVSLTDEQIANVIWAGHEHAHTFARAIEAAVLQANNIERKE